MAGEMSMAELLFQKANEANEAMQVEMDEEFDESSVDLESLAQESTAPSTSLVPYSPSREGPLLWGKDASLFKWDSNEGKVVPVNNTARAVIEGRGDSLDVHQAIPGSYLAQQIVWRNDQAHTSRTHSKMATAPVSTLDELQVLRIISIDEHVRNALSQQRSSEGTAIPFEDAQSFSEADLEEQQRLEAEARGVAPGTRSVDMLEGSLNTLLGATEKGIRVGAALARDGAKETIRGCTELVSKWKENRAKLTQQVANNASEQMEQRQRGESSELALTVDDLGDEGEVESITRGLSPDAIQSNAEALRDQSKDLKKSFDERRQAFRSNLNKNLETIFQAMGYGDPLKVKAASLEQFESELADLPDLKRSKVERAIGEIQAEGSAFKDFITEQAESAEMAQAEPEDQESIANDAKDLENNIVDEVSQKYREMLENIGLDGQSIKSSLGDIFSKIGETINRILERVGLINENIASAEAMHGFDDQQADVRPG